MTMFESTVSMLEMLPEADLMVINSMARRLLARSIEDNPFQPLSQQEWEFKLDRSIRQANEGLAKDALKASSEIRKKYRAGEA